MRLASLTLAAALALTGCDSGEVPSPVDRQQGEAPPQAVPANVVELRGEGLGAGPEAFFFAAGQTEVETALAKALGPSLRTGSLAECGAGPMTFVDFAGGLTAHFQENRLVGWNWHLAQDGDRPATGVVKLAGEVQLGTARSIVLAAPGFTLVEGSTLGEEFALGSNVGGFLESDAVEMLYAGTQCFFR